MTEKPSRKSRKSARWKVHREDFRRAQSTPRKYNTQWCIVYFIFIFVLCEGREIRRGKMFRFAVCHS